MSIARRLFSTTVSRLNVLTEGQAPPHISTADLPPTIYTLIARHIAQSEPSTSYSIPNPFLTHRAATTTEAEGSSSHQYTPRAISRRREKQLLEHYPEFVLPPSKLNPLSTTKSNIRWNDGERDVEIIWTGELGDLKEKSLYGSRKRMFKGHKHERERPERERETQERLQGMDKRINDWRSVSYITGLSELSSVLTLSVPSRSKVAGQAFATILGLGPRISPPATRHSLACIITYTHCFSLSPKSIRRNSHRIARLY